MAKISKREILIFSAIMAVIVIIIVSLVWWINEIDRSSPPLPPQSQNQESQQPSIQYFYILMMATFGIGLFIMWKGLQRMYKMTIGIQKNGVQGYATITSLDTKERAPYRGSPQKIPFWIIHIQHPLIKRTQFEIPQNLAPDLKIGDSILLLYDPQNTGDATVYTNDGAITIKKKNDL